MQLLAGCTRISIHAAREGGDENIPQRLPVLGISIHAAREGGDTDTSSLSAARARFQSTPPVKAATQEAVVDAGLYEISIHAAREGGDAMFTLSVAAGFLFQSTPPVKAATPSRSRNLSSNGISIHAAREGGDEVYGELYYPDKISIHAAREGGDDRRTVVIITCIEFQSTPPVKAATAKSPVRL